MQNRFTHLCLKGILLVFSLSMAGSITAQNCGDNSNPFFTFTYDGPDTIIVGPTCTGTLDWPATTPFIECKPGFNCLVNFFDYDAGLSGLNRMVQIPDGTTVSLYYTLQAVVNPGNILVMDTFCFQIAFADKEAPMFTANPPANVTVNCFSAVPAPVNLTATDNCDDSFPKTIIPTSSGAANLCSGGVLTRLWTAVDSAGNRAARSQVITVIPDTIVPTIGTLPVSQTTTCELADYPLWLSNQRMAVQSSASDNCGIRSITDNAPANFPDTCGTVTVTFTVTDSCSRTAVAIASYTVRDLIAPVITGVGSRDTVRISCAQAIPAVPVVTYSDNCTPVNRLVTAFTEVSSKTNTSICTDYNYTIIRNWRAEDLCRNVTTHTQVIIVTDNTPPNFDAPPTDTISCEESRLPANTGQPTNVSDNCDSSPHFRYRDLVDTLGCRANLRISREWTLRDTCGNQTVKFQTIYVFDRTAPTFTAPADVTVDCDKAGDLRVTGMPTNLTDNCDPAPEIRWTDLTTAGSCLHAYTIARTWIAEDTCGNQRSHVQVITVVDNTRPIVTANAQDVTIVCDKTTDAVAEFNAWVARHGNAIASDNCTPSGNLVWQAFNSGTAAPAFLPNLVCPSPIAPILRRQAVDFIVFDECGNRDTTTASFSLLDTIPPRFLSCGRDTTVLNDPGLCSKTLRLSLPQIEEGCTFAVNTFSRLQTLPVTSNGPFGDPDILVNPMIFNIAVPGAPYVVVDTMVLTLTLNNHDGEVPTEFYILKGEDGSVIGQSSLTVMQCDRSVTVFKLSNLNQLNNWIADGVLRLTLEPNRPVGLAGRFSVNNICPNANAVLQTTFDYEIFSDVLFEYKVNDGARVPVVPFQPSMTISPTFDVGKNAVTYYLTDCASNVDSCIFTVDVLDRERPDLVCPADVTLLLPADGCTTPFVLPLPSTATDNCGLPGQFSQTEPRNPAQQYITFSADPNLGDFLANDKNLSFTGFGGNVVGAGATLTVHFQGDMESAAEYFTVRGENNTVLGTTEVGQPNVVAGNCGAEGTATFVIPPALFNSWIADDQLSISLISNVDIPVPPGGPGSGINPCNRPAYLANGQIDSVSRIWATLTLTPIRPTYFAVGATPIQPAVYLPASPPVVNFKAGQTRIFYTIEDIHGNRDTCTFLVDVLDRQPPSAVCSPTIIRINPAGSVTGSITPRDIGGHLSTDNCGIDTMFVFPNTFTCNQIGDTIQVRLVVRDLFGNTDTCQTFIRVEGVEPQPTFSYTCGADTLYLFANPPAAPGNVVYSYRWFGPLGNLISTTRNPKITDFTTFAAGNYCVEITGLTGCKTIACVNIPLDLRPPQPVITAPSQICAQIDDIVLNTTPPQGVTGIVQYNWYAGTYPQGVFLSTSPTPDFRIPAPHSLPPNTTDVLCFYVIITVDGCASQPSNQICVTIVSPPDATVNTPVVNLCEGQLFQLGTPITGTGITYSWIGPGGFNSTVRNPVVTDSLNFAIHNGNYVLTIFKNGCASPTATTIVNVFNKPDIVPTLFPETVKVCEGDEITFLTNLLGVATYHWVSPLGQEFITTTRNFTVPANPLFRGRWYVYGITAAAQGSCRSDNSNVSTVEVSQFSVQVIASATPNPVCEGQQVRLEVQPSLVDASYMWTKPNGDVVATQNPILDNIRQRDAGSYKVVVTNNNGCSKEATVMLDVSPGVEVVAVSNDAPNCFTAPTSVTLSLIVFPADTLDEYRYRWTGPCSFTSADSLAVVPNVTSACNGVYSVVVTNADGCSSVPKTTVISGAGPLATPTLTRTPDRAAYCEGESLTLTTIGYPGRSVVYTWRTPSGDITTTVPSLTIDSLITTAHNGNFSVRANVDGCLTANSGMLNIRVNTVPVALPEADVPCEGGVLRLYGNVSPTTGSPTFRWDTPSGSLSVRNPVLTPANPNEHNGTYILTVTLNGCVSVPSAVDVIIKKAPVRPLPLPAEPICIWSADTLMLCVNPNSATPGGTYIWTDQFGDTLGTTTSLCLMVTNFSGYTEGQYPFFVEVAKDGCSTKNNQPLIVQFNTLPIFNAFAGSDFSICEDQLVMLQGMPEAATGCWKYLGNLQGVTILDPCSATTQVNGLPPATSHRFEWCLSNGACADYDCDTVALRIYEFENADAGPARIDTCDVRSMQLRAVPSLSGLGFWTQEPVQDQLGVRIVNPTLPNSVVQFPAPGVYKFTWQIPDTVCGGDSDVVLVSISDASPDAGLDFDDCGDGCTVLEANSTQTGRWSALIEGVTFQNETSPGTTVCGLAEGLNLLVWTTDKGVCGPRSRDTVRIAYNYTPVAVDDAVYPPFGGKVEFNAVANDHHVDDYTVTLITPPANGILQQLAGGSFRYTAPLNFIGEDMAVYQLCSVDPNCECTTGVIRFYVGREIEGCVPPNIITPNGDRLNDVFAIPCLADRAKYPQNEIILFNQWGDEVYRKSPYTNDWGGTFDGQELPAGTYFYILDLGTGDKALTGYVVIHR
jgi:gliding motility-associated-like protein